MEPSREEKTLPSPAPCPAPLITPFLLPVFPVHPIKFPRGCGCAGWDRGTGRDSLTAVEGALVAHGVQGLSAAGRAARGCPGVCVRVGASLHLLPQDQPPDATLDLAGGEKPPCTLPFPAQPSLAHHGWAEHPLAWAWHLLRVRCWGGGASARGCSPPPAEPMPGAARRGQLAEGSRDGGGTFSGGRAGLSLLPRANWGQFGAGSVPSRAGTHLVHAPVVPILLAT